MTPMGCLFQNMTIIFKHVLLRNRLANQSNFCGASLGIVDIDLKTNLGHITKMATVPICGKTWLHWELKLFKVGINDDPRLTLTFFTARSTLNDVYNSTILIHIHIHT